MLTPRGYDKAGTTQTGATQGLWSSRWTRAAVVVITVIALLAIAVVVLSPDPTPQAAPETAPSTPATSAAPAAPAGEASACGLAPGEQAVPSVPPVSTDWELVGSMAAPTAPGSIGPGTVDEGLRSCFARSPLGALYAATSFLATTSEPRLRLPAVTQLTARGEGRDRALGLIEGSDTGGDDGGVQFAGFTFLNYDPDEAIVDIALRTGGNVGHLPVPLRWEDGDWKILFPPDGDLYGNIAPLPNLTGYVPWSGA